MQKLIHFLILSIIIGGSLSQTCENEQIAVYTERVRNATRDVINQIQSDVLQVPIESLEADTNITTLYSTIAKSFNITESDEGLANFVEALNVITDAYLSACYGLEEDKPTVEDAPELLNTFLTLLSNRSNFTTIRQLYGKLLCLKNFTSSDNSQKRRRNVECANAVDIKELYECLDPTEIGCIFHLQKHCEKDYNLYKNCLGFIVDTSGSMGDEIDEVRKIVHHFVAAHEDQLTLCYILVTFSDRGPQYTRIYDASYHRQSGGALRFSMSDGTMVYGVDDLLLDVNSMQATGGTENGMTAILNGINLINNIDCPECVIVHEQHHFIVLTDEDTDDPEYTDSVINAATDNTKERILRIHFFFSGEYSHPYYDMVYIATNGRHVIGIDENGITDFIKFIRSELTGTSTIPNRRKRTSCEVFTINFFISRFETLITTDGGISGISFTFTKPDGSTESVDASGNFAYYNVSEPQSGEWQVCASAGAVTVTLLTTSFLDFTVTYLKQIDNTLLPTSDIQFACDSSIFKVSAGHIQYFAPNETLYLDLVDIDGYAIESTALNYCDGTALIGTHSIPAVPAVSYQLRGYDRDRLPFAERSDAIITTQLPELNISLISPVVIIPGMSTQGRLTLYNTKEGPQLLDVNISVATPPEIMARYVNKVQVSPQQATEVTITFIGNYTIEHGDSLNWTVTATAQCYDHETATVQGSYQISVVIGCGNLPRISNGAVTISDSTAQYTCNEGYMLMGDETRTCENTCTYMWSGSQPACHFDHCRMNNGGCQEFCRPLRGGSFECYCHRGYKINDDGFSCSDVDECAEDIDDCEHMCMNTEGSYNCSCFSNYLLADGGKSCTKITYADGYPTTEGDTIRAIVERPEGIAEDSSISCGLSDCTKCRVFHYTQCSYGQEFSISTPGDLDKEHCLVITVTLSSGRSLKEITCYLPVDDNSCSVIQQGQRVEYDLENSTVTFYFGPTEATTNVACSVNGTSSFGACTNSNMHQLMNAPIGQSTLMVCPVNTVDCSGMCRCLQFSFDASKPGREEVDYPNHDYCPTGSF